MTDKTVSCKLFDDYADGELDRISSEAFERHVIDCPTCRAAMERLRQLRAALTDIIQTDLPHDADLRIRRNLTRNADTLMPSDEVMDIEGVAGLLKVPITQVIELLDRIPSFEVGGRLRFRRSRVLEWIEREEKRLEWERDASVLRRPERTIIPFPGKAVGE